MVLTVEDGTGLAAADSYLSVAGADTYAVAYENPDVWSGRSTPDKEHALRVATRYLDARFNARWKGIRANKLQALDWPRCAAEDTDGYAIDSDDLPTQLEDATAQAAMSVLVDGDDLIPDVDAGTGSIERERSKVGDLEREVEWSGTQTTSKTFRLLELTLRDLVVPASMGVRG